MLEALPSWFSIFERDGKRDIPLFRLKQPKWENMKPMIRQTGFIWLLVLKNLKCFQIYGMSEPMSSVYYGNMILYIKK